MKNTKHDNEECKSPWSNTLWMDSFKEGITAKLIDNCSNEEIKNWKLIIYSNGEILQTLHFNNANELDQYIEKADLKRREYDIVPLPENHISYPHDWTNNICKCLYKSDNLCPYAKECKGIPRKGCQYEKEMVMDLDYYLNQLKERGII